VFMILKVKFKQMSDVYIKMYMQEISMSYRHM